VRRTRVVQTLPEPAGAEPFEDKPYSAFPADTIVGAFDRRGNQFQSWQDFIGDVVIHMYERTPSHLRIEAELDEALDVLECVHPEAGHASDLTTEHYSDGAHFCALLGYALGRVATERPGLEYMHGWLTAALRLAGFEGDHKPLPYAEAEAALSARYARYRRRDQETKDEQGTGEEAGR
jgi:hypothetical protein